MHYYKLEIDVQNKNNLIKLNGLLGVTGKTLGETQWYYEFEERDDDEYYDFATNFHKILNPNIDSLKTLGISKDDITIWYMYEYKQQCNIELDASQIKKIASLGVTLCISCCEK